MKRLPKLGSLIAGVWVRAKSSSVDLYRSQSFERGIDIAIEIVERVGPLPRNRWIRPSTREQKVVYVIGLSLLGFGLFSASSGTFGKKGIIVAQSISKAIRSTSLLG